MTSFAGFVVADAPGKLAKVRDVKRSYESDYHPSGDFWSRLRDGVERIHRNGGSKKELEAIWRQAKDNRPALYRSACEGYAKFWGRRRIKFVGTPKPALWSHSRLKVRVNPEWVLDIDGQRTLVKVHTSKDLVLNQRLVNPLIWMIEDTHPGDRQAIILDVHRGKAWQRRNDRIDFDAVLRMEASAFIAGWDILTQDEASAA
jgi:hypothetical protein